MNRLAWLTAAFVVAMAAGPAVAQMPTGDVSGVVMSETGEPLPGVVVELRATEGQIIRTTTTAADGTFLFRSLPEGRYELVATMEGFATVAIPVEVGVARSTSVELKLSSATTSEVITVTSEEVSSAVHPSWNTWLEVKDAAEGVPVERLTVGTYYDFYLDLSRFAYEKAGVESSAIRETMLDELRRAFFAEPRRNKLTAHVRPVLIGRRSVRLLGDRLQASTWRQGAWVESPDSGMVRFEVRVADLLGESWQEPVPGTGWRELTDSARAGGVRFPIVAERAGCAAVALSIWDADRQAPIDYVVHTLTVGDATCEAAADGRELQAGFVTALYGATGSESQGALQLLELEAGPGLSGRTVAVYAPKESTGGCDHFAWDFPGALSSYLFEDAFKASIQRAWASHPPPRPDLYPKVAERIRRLIFPQAKDPRTDCGGWEALQSLRELAGVPGRNLLVHFVDRDNESLFVPLGLLFALEEPGSGEPQRVFVNPPSLRQALPIESYLEPERCVDSWTFILPEELYKDPNNTTKVELPPFVATYEGTRRSLDGFREWVKSMRNRYLAPDDPPLGIVILAHHVGGELYLDDPDDIWLWTELEGVEVPHGSIAVLSACSTGNLSRSRDLVQGLNRAGFDTIILSPFDIYTPFGVTFAVNFSEQVVDSLARAEETRIDQLFAKALSATIGKLEGKLDHVAHGMALEFLLAGHNRMRLCGRRQEED